MGMVAVRDHGEILQSHGETLRTILARLDAR